MTIRKAGAPAFFQCRCRQGLPTELILSKVYEGLAKQFQAGAVVKAMERVRSRYEFATKQAMVITYDKTKINRLATILAESMGGHGSDSGGGIDGGHR